MRETHFTERLGTILQVLLKEDCCSALVEQTALEWSPENHFHEDIGQVLLPDDSTKCFLNSTAELVLKIQGCHNYLYHLVSIHQFRSLTLELDSDISQNLENLNEDLKKDQKRGSKLIEKAICFSDSVPIPAQITTWK